MGLLLQKILLWENPWEDFIILNKLIAIQYRP